jgi:NAD(P) transhydrogenase
MPPKETKEPKEPNEAKKNHFDLVVIGSGPGGQRAAMQGAKAGKHVAVVEDYPLVGGGCVHFGTLPSKSFRESVYRWSLGSQGTLGQEREHATVVKSQELPDMSRLLRRKDRVVSGEVQVIHDQLKRNGITLFQGRGRLTTPNTIEISSTKKGASADQKETITADYVVLAVGARPVAPAHLGLDGKVVLDSNTILNLKKLPKTMMVLGAGIIGCEYASMFSMAGCKVYLVDRRHEILASVDREVVNHLVERFVAGGVEVLLEAEAQKIEKNEKGEGCKVHLSTGKKLNVDVVLVAQGRFGNTDGLGLEEVGIDRDERGLIKVDQHFRTTVPNIYAVGDVVGSPALASTSMEQGRLASCHAFAIEDSGMPQFYPYGIYTIPEISMIGPTEEELVHRKVEFVVGRARYRELARGQIVGDSWGLLKLLVDKKTLKLLGIHIVGDNAADLIHIGQAVMAFGGDANYFIRNVFNYPTLAEAYKTAAFHAVNQIKGTTNSK